MTSKQKGAKLYKRVLDRTAQERDPYKSRSEKYRVALEEIFEWTNPNETKVHNIAKQALEGDEK